jgi:RNA polymerase sigma-70 factor, ECF subfamily
MKSKLDTIWADLYEGLQTFISRKIQDQELAKDILQDVFIKVHQHIHTLKDPLKITSWIYQITRNLLIDHARRKITVHELTEDIVLPLESTADPIYHSLHNCLMAKIASLPVKYREVIILNSFKNYSQIQLSHHLHIPYSSVKTRIQRGRHQLRKAILACSNVHKNKKGELLGFDL